MPKPHYGSEMRGIGGSAASGTHLALPGALAKPRALALGLALGLALTACSSSAKSVPQPKASGVPSAGSSSHARPRAGTADVAFAGSLLAVDNEVVGPGFERATGYAYTGRGGGSIGLAHEIAAGEITPGVFESVGAAPIAVLEPKFTRWYVQLAASPLVLAYSPSSPYAATFEAVTAGKKPLEALFSAMATPGFRLGRTNPATDPQGQAFVMMLELAQASLHLPAGTLEKIIGKGVLHGTGGRQSQIFSETALDAHLEAGQLDAASAFLSQAVQLHLHYVTLPASIDLGNPADASSYARASLVVPGSTPGTTTTVHGAPLVIDATTLAEPSESAASSQAAAAFVAYLASPAGRAAYQKEGFTLLPEKISGPASAVPPAVRRAVSRAAS